MRVSKKWKFSALENEFAPLENHPRGPRAWNDQHTTWTKVNFFNFQNWLVQSPWGGKTLRGGLDQWSGGYSGVISGFSRIVQNLIVAQFISQHPYTSGTCSFGSKLFIHALSDGLSFTDLRRTCLFYLGGVKVKLANSEICQNKFTASIFTRPPYTSGSSPFGSEPSIHALTDVFSFNDIGWTCLFFLGAVKVKMLKISNWSKSVKINSRPQFSLGPLTHLEPLLLAQSCPSMHYETFFVSRTLVEVDNWVPTRSKLGKIGQNAEKVIRLSRSS